MKIFGFSIGKRKIKTIIADINSLLPVDMEYEEDFLNRLKTLVVFLGDKRQKEIETIVNYSEFRFALNSE